jgi:hypothetical protein
LKSQIPNAKSQRIPKPQSGKIGVWSVAFLWVLGFGVWSFVSGCDNSPRRTPPQGTYGQINATPSTNISRARPPQPLSFDNSALLTCIQTELSPATLFHTETNRISFFTELDGYGLGAPSYAAFATSAGLRAFKSGGHLESEHMEQNWVLVWFSGARGWTNGDIPCVVYLQHKPSSMRLDTNGLHFRFAGPAGDIVLLPLYGTCIAPLQGNGSSVVFAGKKLSTWTWSDVLTREPLMRVRYWSSALREFPIYCEETFSVDRSSDTITIRQRIHYHSINDDWKTKHLKLNPLSPSFGLAWKNPESPIKFRNPPMDLEMPTPFGPSSAAEGDASLDAKFAILQYVNEERSNISTPTNSNITPANGSWARWAKARPDQIDPAQYAAMARQAYRSGDIDAYNYGCYLFARAFTVKYSAGASPQTPASERLIPAGPPSPFVPGLEREAKGPNPHLVQRIITASGAWPRVNLLANSAGDRPWNLGHVRIPSAEPPSQVERVPLNWNTEVVRLRQ